MIDSPEVRRPRVPRLHVVTNDSVLGDDRFGEDVESLLRAGGDRIALHLRGHYTTGRSLMEHAARCARVARETGATLLINDRVDVALACAADGIQLGQRSMPPADVRSLLGPEKLIGVSIHTPAEARRGAKEGADFLVAGTLYPSMSHPDRPPSGLAWLFEISDLGLPVIGIGGIDPKHVGDVLAAGAHGVAVIRGIWGADSAEAALLRYLDRLD